jgi:hypothetical protein
MKRGRPVTCLAFFIAIFPLPTKMVFRFLTGRSGAGYDECKGENRFFFGMAFILCDRMSRAFKGTPHS